MSKDKKATLNVQGTAIAVVSQQENDFISLTDIARHRATIEFHRIRWVCSPDAK